VEGIMLTIGLFLVSGIKGSTFWTLDVVALVGGPAALGPMPLNHVFVVFGGLFIGYNVLMSFLNIRSAKQTRHAADMTTNALVVFLPYLVYVPLNTLWIFWASAIPDEQILGRNLMVPFMYAMGIGFAYQVGHMVLAHVCQRAFPVWNHVWSYTLLCTLLTFLKSHALASAVPSQTVLVWGYVLVTVGLYAVFAHGVIREMCEIFDIWCLRIKHLPEAEVERIRTRGWKGWDVLGLRKLPPSTSVSVPPSTSASVPPSTSASGKSKSK